MAFTRIQEMKMKRYVPLIAGNKMSIDEVEPELREEVLIRVEAYKKELGIKSLAASSEATQQAE